MFHTPQHSSASSPHPATSWQHSHCATMVSQPSQPCIVSNSYQAKLFQIKNKTNQNRLRQAELVATSSARSEVAGAGRGRTTLLEPSARATIHSLQHCPEAVPAPASKNARSPLQSHTKASQAHAKPSQLLALPSPKPGQAKVRPRRLALPPRCQLGTLNLDKSSRLDRLLSTPAKPATEHAG